MFVIVNWHDFFVQAIHFDKIPYVKYVDVSNPFKNPEVVDALSSLHDKYVVVPADKASNNIVFK